MTEQKVKEISPEKRLAQYLGERLHSGSEAHSIAKLAEALGYSHPTTVRMWTEGKAKVPLRLITPIARFLNIDHAEILPLWFLQQVPEDEHLYRAGTRILDPFEFMLVSVARDIYGAEKE